MKNFGTRLKELRLSKDYTMDKLADELNSEYNLKITKSMISRWETGKAEPTNIFMSAYARYFNVDLNYIVGLTPEKRVLRNDMEDDRIANLNVEELSQLDKILNETNLFFNDETVDDDDKKKLRSALMEIFFDALAENKKEKK